MLWGVLGGYAGAWLVSLVFGLVSPQTSAGLEQQGLPVGRRAVLLLLALFRV